MARHAKYVFTMNEDVKVGYAPKPRGGLFRVQFRHPTEPGKYIEAATGVAVPKGWNKTPPPAWSAEAEKLIKAAYTAVTSDAPADQSRASWEEAERYFMEEINAGSLLRLR